MRRSSIGKLLLAALIMLAPLAAATTDISGMWSGSMVHMTDDGIVASTPVVAEFKQDGKTITGTATAAGREPMTIEKGVLEGDRLTFEIHAPEGTYAVKMALVGASELKGEVTFTETTGRTGTATLTFSRN